MEPRREKVKKIAGDLNVRLPLTTYVCGSGLSLPGYIRRERPSTPSAHMALTRPVVPPDGSFILGVPCVTDSTVRGAMAPTDRNGMGKRATAAVAVDHSAPGAVRIATTASR
ncbi:hypothetical protein ACVI1K_004427 [Bradyrhizobium sp. USDA 4508]